MTFTVDIILCHVLSICNIAFNLLVETLAIYIQFHIFKLLYDQNLIWQTLIIERYQDFFKGFTVSILQ